MKVSELRLANYIFHNGEVMPVVQIERRYKTMFRVNDLDVDERIIEDHFQPIPLTPEWLERLGFKMLNAGWINNSGSLVFWDSSQNREEWFTLEYGTRNYQTRFKYVHQLQNLYFTLTGEELIINNVNLKTSS